MKIALIAINNEGYPNEFVGIGSIASYLEFHGIDVNILQYDVPTSCQVEDLKKEELLEYDLLGFYIIYTNASLVTGVIDWIKANNGQCHIFVGGQCATVAADEILDDCKGIDYIVLGDGEIPVYNLVQAITDGKAINNLESIKTRYDIIEKKPYIIDISELPWIKRYYYKKEERSIYANARMVTSKRCIGKCSFCSTIHSNRRVGIWECRDMNDVFEEIKFLYETYGIRYFSFVDPSFEDPGELGKKRIESLCNLLKEYPVKFFFWCYLRAETFSEKDEPLIKLMREVGFAKVFIGIESFNEEDLKLFDKKATVEDNYRALKLFKKYNFEICPGIIMIHPLTTKEQLTNNFYHMTENRLDLFYLYVTVLELFRKTPLYEKLRELDLVTDEHSYKNPFGYKIRDPYVSEVFAFIVGTINKSKIIKKENQYRYTYNFIMTTIRELFHEEYIKIEPSLEEITAKIFEEIKNYFSILYVQYDLQAAYDKFDEFEERLSDLYDQVYHIMLQLLKEKSVRSYLKMLQKGHISI